MFRFTAIVTTVLSPHHHLFRKTRYAQRGPFSVLKISGERHLYLFPSSPPSFPLPAFPGGCQRQLRRFLSFSFYVDMVVEDEEEGRFPFGRKEGGPLSCFLPEATHPAESKAGGAGACSALDGRGTQERRPGFSSYGGCRPHPPSGVRKPPESQPNTGFFFLKDAKRAAGEKGGGTRETAFDLASRRF